LLLILTVLNLKPSLYVEVYCIYLQAVSFFLQDFQMGNSLTGAKIDEKDNF